MYRGCTRSLVVGTSSFTCTEHRWLPRYQHRHHHVYKARKRQDRRQRASQVRPLTLFENRTRSRSSSPPGPPHQAQQARPPACTRPRPAASMATARWLKAFDVRMQNEKETGTPAVPAGDRKMQKSSVHFHFRITMYDGKKNKMYYSPDHCTNNSKIDLIRLSGCTPAWPTK